MEILPAEDGSMKLPFLYRQACVILSPAIRTFDIQTRQICKYVSDLNLNYSKLHESLDQLFFTCIIGIIILKQFNGLR